MNTPTPARIDELIEEFELAVMQHGGSDDANRVSLISNARQAILDALAAPVQSVSAVTVTGEAFAGLLYDFAGFPTCRAEVTTLSSRHDAGPAVEAIRAFAADRQLTPYLNSSNVCNWRELLAAQLPTPAASPATGTLSALCEKWGAEDAAAQVMQPVEASPALRSDDLVLVPRDLLGAACSAIDKKRDAPNVLKKLRDITYAATPPVEVAAPVAPSEPRECLPELAHSGSCLIHEKHGRCTCGEANIYRLFITSMHIDQLKEEIAALSAAPPPELSDALEMIRDWPVNESQDWQLTSKTMVAMAKKALKLQAGGEKS